MINSGAKMPPPDDLSLVLDFLRTTIFPIFVPVGTALLGFWLRGFEYRRDTLHKQIEVITEEVNTLLAVGCLYWSTNSQVPKCDEEYAREAEILGRLHGVNTLFEVVAGKCKGTRVMDVRTSISEFRQTLTGGQFGALAGHSANSTVISKSYTVAAELRTRLGACI
jgi:hypothetical protein